MGTRALISKEGEPWIATHWDGYPSGLGADLLEAGATDKAIIAVAMKHTIDAAGGRARTVANKVRFKHIADKANKGIKLNSDKKRYTVADIEKLDKDGMQLSFNLMCAGDYSVANISDYGDFAEYEYNFVDGVWKYRSLSGCCPESRKGRFKKLTKKACKEQE